MSPENETLPSRALKANDNHISAIPVSVMACSMEPPVYNRYSTWVLIDNRGPQNVLRILLADKEHLYLIKIGGMDGSKPLYFSPTKRATDRIRMERSECDRLYFAQRFRCVHDSFIPSQMEVGTCAPGMLEKFEKKKEVVAYALSQWGDLLLQNQYIYAKAINALVVQFSASDVSIRRWIETSYFYREHPNALLHRTWEQGGKSERQGQHEQKKRFKSKTSSSHVGRPPSSKRLGMKGVHEVRRLSPRIKALMENFIEKEVWATNDPYPYIHSRMLEHGLVAYNKGSDGKPMKHKIGEDKLPPAKRLKELGRKIYNRCLAKVVEITGTVRGLGYKDAGGTANDIVHDDLPIYDLDATVADNYLLYGDGIIQIDGCAKPTVVMATDRRSKAIVGLYVTYKAESADGYLGCLISAFLPKEWELELWGASHLDGMVFGCPSGIFVDRGAGSSEKVTSKIVEKIRAHSIFAKPGTPQAKPTVERSMGKFQEVLARVISGSYFPSGDIDLDKVRKRYAEDGAVPVQVFMRALWDMVSQHNLSVDTALEATPDMLKDPNFAANPKGVFNYYRRRRRGDIAWDWPLETIIKKLGDELDLKAPDGTITIENREFSSPSLVRYAKAHQEQYGKTYVGKVYQLRTLTFTLFWDSPFGRLVQLKAKPRTVKTFTSGHKWHIEMENMHRNHVRKNARKEDAANEKKKWNAKQYVSEKTQKDMTTVDRGSRKKNKDMTPEERIEAKRAGTEFLQRLQSDGLYGPLRQEEETAVIADTVVRPSLPSRGFNNDQVLRIKR